MFLTGSCVLFFLMLFAPRPAILKGSRALILNAFSSKNIRDPKEHDGEEKQGFETRLVALLKAVIHLFVKFN